MPNGSWRSWSTRRHRGKAATFKRWPGRRRSGGACPRAGACRYISDALYTGMAWTIETLSAVDAEIEALPVALRARLLRLLETVETVGLDALRAPHVRHLDGKLWELRVRAEGGIARGIYVTAAGRRVVVLHVFAKKSRRTPRRALATARERMRQVTR